MEPDFLAQRPFEDDLLLSRMDTESDGKGDGNGSPSGPGGPGATTGEGSNGDGEDGEPQGPQSHRDLQRWALQELVTLTTQCANQETRVAVQLQKSTAENNTKAQRGHADLERNYKGLQDQIAQKYEERQKEIDSRYRQVAQVLKERDEETKSRAATESERAQRDIKQSYEQAVWLSESVQEAAEGKAAEDLKKANETFLNQKEYLEGKEKDAQSLLERYGQPAPPGEPLATIKAAEETEDPIASFARHRDTIEEQLKKLAALTVPNLLVGARPYLAVFLLLIVAVVAPQAIKQTMQPQLMELGISLGAAGILATVGILVMRSMAKKQVATTFVPLRRALDAARIGNDNMLARAKDQQSMEVSKARRQQKAEALLARDKAAPALERAKQKKEKTLQTAKTTLTTKTSENEQQRDSGLKEVEEWRENKTAEVKQRYEAEFAKIDQRAAERKAAIQKQFAADRAALEKKWKDGLAHIQEPIQEGENKVVPWNDPSWNAWKPPTKFPATVPFGQMKIDLKTIVADVAKDNPFTLPLPETFMVPALFAFPRQASMLIHTDRVGRAPSIAAMQMMMARLLTCLPPGRVRFTLIDPVGLGQNFSGFMHLADYDEALVGGRIWTEEDQINQRLENLTEHMETVIQKYLRNEFATIDDYNAQAGELAEPYRFLIVSDFPQNFSDEAFRRLSSIATTGSRCGVYTLIMRDTRINSSGGSTSVEDVQAHSINLAFEDGRFVWRDEVFRRFPLTLDAPPEEDELTKIMHQVGKRAREANRVEVPFDTIAPKPEQFWTQKSASDLQVAIGRCGATRLQSFRLGKGVAQHALVAGKTGSGKSTMLHALIANLAMWYSPEEVELYLIDFKKGVEFKTYAAHMLPHARAIAVESDREFGLSVLQRIDAELARRGELFRKAEVQDLASYRAATNTKMPRTLLIIDEFQEFFSDDDKLAQDASGLLDRLVRQGRAFGIHVLLGSQTIGGSSGLSPSTIGQRRSRSANTR